MDPIMTLRRKALYLVIFHALFYSVLIASMYVNFGNEELRRILLEESLKSPMVSFIIYLVSLKLYNIAMLVIFLANLIVGTLLTITLPSVMPGAGLLMLLWRAYMWGVIYNLAHLDILVAILPTLLLEAEGYVIALIGSFDIGLVLLRTRRREERREAFIRSLKECISLYLLVIVFLSAAAVVEVFTLANVR
ncbi:MAG: hypothetical protein DRN15_08500 [Thermoprotei archaeon]|nr:MAG: hypothetical protein DRN15_08500 [Thermoprotei archaeon]RLF25774.1 MAG: hypothetical protein DRM97_00720 [Thermoprotei archaeon]